MTYVLRFLPIIEENALAGSTWYGEKASRLGGEFLRMFYAGAREIPRNPLLYTNSSKGRSDETIFLAQLTSRTGHNSSDNRSPRIWFKGR